jgi:hypothetical protein
MNNKTIKKRNLSPYLINISTLKKKKIRDDKTRKGNQTLKGEEIQRKYK